MAGCKRDRKKGSFWRRMVRRQAGSGLGVRAWCREHEVAEHSFYAWRRELTLRDAEQATSVFVPVQVTEDAVEPAGPIEIVLAGGRCVRISGPVDRQVLADVLAVMTSTSSVESEGRAC